jgi:hypothetical protein
MIAERETGFSARGSRQEALARWENEGGAVDANRQASSDAEALLPLADAELMQLRIRIIALENLLVALLADASEAQLHAVRKMAGYIAPRPGFTPHKLTIHAEGHMLDLVERAARFTPRESRN